MNEDFRKRVFTPLVLPLALLGAIALFAWSMSRVFLALPAIASAFAALLVAAYVLGIGAWISRLREVTTRSLAVGLVLGLAGVVGAGTVASAVGPREFHSPADEAAEDDEGGQGEEEEPDAVEIPDDAVVWRTIDNEYVEAPDTVPAGTVTFALVNEGNIVHNVHIEETDEQVIEAESGSTALAEVEFEPGTYTYYCDIPGHRATMNGAFTVEG